jgi:beta-carotene 3-hydroxylase
MYMFVHDGLVHKRFPVGPIAEVPYLKRVAAAHKLHHAERFNGVPWGLFLGPAELEAVGGKKDLDYMCQEMDRKKALKS